MRRTLSPAEVARIILDALLLGCAGETHRCLARCECLERAAAAS